MDNQVFSTYYYVIAELCCRVQIPSEYSIGSLLPSCEPFKKENGAHSQVSIAVEDREPEVLLLGSWTLLAEKKIPTIGKLSIFENDTHYYIQQDYSDYHVPLLGGVLATKDFSENIVYLPLKHSQIRRELSTFIMTIFAQAAVLYNTVLIHASTVVNKSCAYAFIAPSGTGKSTHSKLWIENISDTFLLNDDNPAIKIHPDGQVYIYGTPWSGKTPCYKNQSYPLGALVRIKQAPHNSIQALYGVSAFTTVLPSCSSMKWNPYLYRLLCDIVESLVHCVPIFELQCLPNPEAALLSYESTLNAHNSNL